MEGKNILSNYKCKAFRSTSVWYIHFPDKPQMLLLKIWVQFICSFVYIVVCMCLHVQLYTCGGQRAFYMFVYTVMCVCLHVQLCTCGDQRTFCMFVCFYSDVCVSTCSTVHLWRSEDTFRSCVFLSHHTVGPGVWTKTVGLGEECFYLLVYGVGSQRRWWLCSIGLEVTKAYPKLWWPTNKRDCQWFVYGFMYYDLLQTETSRTTKSQ